MTDTSHLRKHLRKQRRQLNRFQQRQAEQAVFSHFIHLVQFKAAQHIGVYLHAFGEVHTTKLIEYCFSQHKTVYLPMICSMDQNLRWVPISKHLYDNRRFSHHPLGMKEPMASRGKSVQSLDLLIMPLLACDRFGTRIGMGGGFYDRTLANTAQRPYRLGLAHDFQMLDKKLQREAWDQPLDALVTPSKVYRFKR